MNPIMLQAIKNLAQRQGNDVTFVVGPPPPEDPVRIFSVFVGLAGEWQMETYCDSLGPDARAMCFDAAYLNRLTEQGYSVVLVFDPARCSHEKLWECGFFTTEEGTPERAAEEQAHAAVFPELKAENLYRWADVKPGQFLAQIEARK